MSAPPGSIRILVVDDEAAPLEALTDALHHHGYVADGFRSGRTALDAFAKTRYDLILTDLMMPGMDGIAVLQEVKRLDADAVGILMTGAGTIATAVEAMKAGAFDYLLKPFTLSFLIPVLMRAISVRALRVENSALQRGMRARTAELEIANRELESFSYSVSHDLTSPLRAISHFSAILDEEHAGKLDEAGRAQLGRIRANAERMGQLIESLLMLSTISRSPIAAEQVDFSALAVAVGSILRDSEPARPVSLVVADGLSASGDPALLRVLLDNLIGNAWKYTGRQSAPRIEVGATATATHPPTFFVRDNGAGFDAAYAYKLFIPFQRLHRAEEFPGTGIGLSIVARIVRRHGGRIWAESAVDQGATFFFTLSASDLA